MTENRVTPADDRAVITTQRGVAKCEVHHASRYEMRSLAQDIIMVRKTLTLCHGCHRTLMEQERKRFTRRPHA